MRRVVILTLGDSQGSGTCGDTCDCQERQAIRVPVLACADTLRAKGARVDTVTACDDSEIDVALKPVLAGETTLVVAASTDGEVRAVVRRLVRQCAPPPSKRPADLPAHRTVFDLPALAILPLAPATPDLIRPLGLPTRPEEVAAAVLAGEVRRLDLLRNDGGSATLHGSLIGGPQHPWRGRVEVDDAVLTNGEETVLACAIRNASPSTMDGLPLVTSVAPDDGALDVAVAVPVLRRRLLREAEVHVEVRRARGRAVSVTPHADEVRLVDDGVTARLTRKRSWWVEHKAWAVYAT